MSDPVEPRLLHYACRGCHLLYAEQVDTRPNPHVGLCPRCGAFNEPDELADPVLAADRRTALAYKAGVDG